MKNRYAVGILLVSLTALGVSSAEAPFSIGVPDAAWQSSVLNVCWQSDPSRVSREVVDWAKANRSAKAPSAETKANVQRWATAAYSLSRVGIGFSGFVDCPKDEASLAKYPVYLVNDIDLWLGLLHWLFSRGKLTGISVVGDHNRYEKGGRIVKTYKRVPIHEYLPWITVPVQTGQKVLPFKAAAGFDLDAADEIVAASFKRLSDGIERSMGLDPSSSMPNSLQKYIRAETAKERDAYRIESNQFTVLHELGHLVGLLHEDRRKDAKADRPKYCWSISGDDGDEGDGWVPPESVFSTQYDPLSIMSYCRENMQRLFRQARLVCRLAPKLDQPTRTSIGTFLKNCPEIERTSFPIDLTLRDVTALRQMYLKEAPKRDEWLDFRKSPSETRLLEMIDETARLPFDPLLSAMMAKP